MLNLGHSRGRGRLFLTTMTNPLARQFTPEEKSRYDKNKKIVVLYGNSAKMWLQAVAEIRIKQDYLQEGLTWEKWCAEYVPWRSCDSIDRALREEAKKLPQKVGSSEPVEVQSTTEPAEEGDIRDETGFAVPKHLCQVWGRRKELNTLKAEISTLKRAIESAWDKHDPLALKIDQSVIEDLKAAYHCVTKAQLYCVCGTCQGWFERVSGGICLSCNSTGFMSKDQYDRLLPEQIKAIRERAAKLQK